MTTQTAQRMPAQRHDLLGTMSGLRQYLEDQRKHEGAQYDALHEAAHKTKRALILYCKAQNRGNRKSKLGTLTPAQRIGIRKFTKCLERAADLHMESAKFEALCYTHVVTMFPEVRPKKPAGAFDPNK